jgi:hypothetical protein
VEFSWCRCLINRPPQNIKPSESKRLTPTTTHPKSIQILGIKFCQVALDAHYTIDPRFYGVHTVLGSILAFITVFRCVISVFLSWYRIDPPKAGQSDSPSHLVSPL